jgi:asparagine synthase (glutamine-hydrolysing)
VADAGELRNTAEAYLLQRSIRWQRNKSTGQAEHLQARVGTLRNDFQKLAALELEFYMRNQLLRDADVFSMAHSVELRVPFLDLALVEEALALSPEHHFARGRFPGAPGKRLTRRILSDLLGEPLSQRRKMGFTFPWRQWLRQALRDTISHTLRDQRLYDPLRLDPAYGRTLLDGLERDDRLQSWAEVWSLFVLLNWQSRAEML